MASNNINNKVTKLSFRTKVKKIFSKGRQITRGHGGASAASRKTTSTDPKPVNAVGQSSPSPAVNQSSSSPSLANGVLPVSVVPSVNQSSSSPTPANAASQSSPSPAPANGVLQVSAPPPASPPDPSPVNGPPSAAANSSTAVQQSSPLVSSPHFWSPEALWDDAYKTLKTREPELITEFEQILGGHVTSNEQVQAKVQAQLDGRVAEQWMVHVMDKDVRIRQMAENIFKFLIWSKDLVSTSLTGQPHLALAWSGITMLLPLVLTPTTESDAMIQGLDHITSILTLYQLRIKLQRNSGSVEYRTTVVNLYSCCLEYQAKMACHLSKRTLSRGFHALTESGQWTALKEKIDEADEECTKYQDLIDRKQEDEMWQLQAKRMEEQEMILRQLYKMRLDELNARAADREDDLRDKVIECLVGDYPEHKDANPEAVENTCRWFLDDPRFHNWRDSTTSSLLWLYAGAGCGKSVLSRMLIDKDHLIPAGRAMTSTVCYFFFKNLDNRNSGADALRGILHQLYTQRLHDNLISVAYEATKIYKQKLGSMFNVLWDLLLNTAKQPATGEIICVLDALDECQANARKALLVKIVEFYNACAKATNPQGPQQPCIKFLITSQYRDDIDLRFVHLDPTSNFIRFPGDDRSDLLRQEIDLVIDRLIPEKVPRLNQQSQLLLAEHLKSIDHRTYLWLHLILEEIEQKFPSNSTLARIKTLIAELPNTVNGAYEGILVRSPDPENTRMILQILLAAKRELTVNELITAWHVARSHQTPQSYQDLDLPDQAFREGSLQSVCGSFIRIFDSKVMLIHETARQYLICRSSLRQQSLDLLPSPSQVKQSAPRSTTVWKHSLALVDCEHLCARICMTVICFRFEDRDCPWAPVCDSARIWTDEFDAKATQLPLLEYSSGTWAEHFRNSEDKTSQDEIRLAASLCDPRQRIFTIWFPVYWLPKYSLARRIREPSITICSLLGLSRVLELMASEGANVNAQGGYFGTALQAASVGGHEKVVKILLDQGAYLNTDAGYYGTALQAGSAHGADTVVQMLLERGAEVNAEGGQHGNALKAAAENGHDTIVQMLLDHGARIITRGSLYDNALHAASAGGHESMVQMLITKGADVNLPETFHGNALQAASTYGHEAVVQLLLKSGADVNAQGGPYSNALLAAIDGGFERVVRILLDWGADIHASTGSFDGNALHLASMAGNETIVQMLLDRGADVNASGGVFGHALQAASAHGHEKVVRKLLDNKAEVNAVGGDCHTALQAARDEGYNTIVQMLLDAGAVEITPDDEDEDDDGGSMMSISSSSRGEEGDFDFR